MVAPVGGRRFVGSYTVQRLGSGRANHAVYWLQDDVGESMPAVVVSAGVVAVARQPVRGRPQAPLALEVGRAAVSGPGRPSRRVPAALPSTP